MGDRGLGDFLRSRRARLRPDEVGLPGGNGRRQTVGLRREEVAVLAGVSIDYYLRLEQGRDIHPGATVLAGLAHALRLDADERAHLQKLASHVAPQPVAPASTAGALRPGLEMLLRSLRPAPCWVLDPMSNVLAANPEGWAILHGIEVWPAASRSVIRYVFTHPHAREVFSSWLDVARDCVADLRAVSAVPSYAPAVTELVSELEAVSSDFVALWRAYDVRVNVGGHRVLYHPNAGRLELTTEILTDRRGQRVVIFQAEPGTTDHRALHLLSPAEMAVPR